MFKFIIIMQLKAFSEFPRKRGVGVSCGPVLLMGLSWVIVRLSTGVRRLLRKSNKCTPGYQQAEEACFHQGQTSVSQVKETSGETGQEGHIKSQRKCFKKELAAEFSQAHWEHQLKLPADPGEHRAAPPGGVLSHSEVGRRYSS